MVRRQIAARGVADKRVLAAMREVPRESFLDEGLQEFAFDDTPLPIGEGQTISQPYIVALMLEAAEIGPGDRVLEVGTGSGYSAAVLCRLARRAYTIERHATLAEAAKARLTRLGCRNLEVRVGDGSLGWPEEAPFDVILVTAGAPCVPQALWEQLAPGGRLIVPVSDGGEVQRLLRVRRIGKDRFEEENLGDVAFVPLVGEQGWQAGRVPARQAGPPESLPELIRRVAEPVPAIGSEAFARLADRMAAAKVVLIGEASHGTDEFYRARARLTQRLIEAHGFTIVAVEADWPDAAQIDRHVRGRAAMPSKEQTFARFPTWMWRNTAVRDFVDWLHAHNATVAEPARHAGFYGLDLYSLGASIQAVLETLDRLDPELARAARERYGCLTPWQRDPAAYGRAALRPGFRTCEEKVLSVLQELLRARMDGLREGGDDVLDAQMNARVVADAERYYRSMYEGAAESWNLRDTHMFETLAAVLARRGLEAKAVVWAHNSHIGNAAATEMGVVREKLNIGQLCRERFGSGAMLVGMGTDRGTVAAASDWDGPTEVKKVRPSLPESYERLCRDSALPAFLLELREGRADGSLRHQLLRPRLERAIGVIYRPETERWSHYFEASLPRQFDLYLWFEETKAVTPLASAHLEGAPETWPFGV
jgi:protein-L-isoaspartate(D-aspartate) O-methyltransferase